MKIEIFSQGRNRLTDKGTLALAEALQVNASLQELEIVSRFFFSVSSA
jgi:hypothetical protein